jgi:hypothetical protein
MPRAESLPALALAAAGGRSRVATDTLRARRAFESRRARCFGPVLAEAECRLTRVTASPTSRDAGHADLPAPTQYGERTAPLSRSYASSIRPACASREDRMLGMGGRVLHVAIPACACDPDPVRMIGPLRARPIRAACASNRNSMRTRSGPHASLIVPACAWSDPRMRMRWPQRRHAPRPACACDPVRSHSLVPPHASHGSSSCVPSLASMPMLPWRDVHAIS